MTDDYSRALARAAVGQLAELAGYEAVQESAAEVLSELLIKYITELSGTAHGYAELANRTGINLHDLLLSLDDLGTSVPELQAYLSSLTPDANTFTHPITDYPIRKPARTLPTWKDKQEQPPDHIPTFLPAFPDKHTYQSTPTYPGHETNPDKQAKMLQKARKQAESSLLKLHHATSSAAKASKAAAADGPDKASQKSNANAGQPSNPFLEPPSVNVVQVPETSTTAMPSLSQLPGRNSSVEPIQGTGAYEPQAASKAFANVLGKPVTEDGQQGTDVGNEGSTQPTQTDIKIEPDLMIDDVMAPEELNWRFQLRIDEKGALLQPLGTSSDYTSLTAAAAQTYAVGRPEADAYEEAAKEEAAAAATGTQRDRKRKSIYGNVSEPHRRRAQEVLERAKDPNAAQEGDD